MKVMLVGNGGREHALAWKLTQSIHTKELMCVPGNAGILSEPKSTCRPVESNDVNQLVGLAVEFKPDLVVIGPEAPLDQGIVDRLEDKGISVFGPVREAARLEGSKAFAKQIMQRYKIPTAEFEIFDQFDAAVNFVKKHPDPWVVKADGLAAGKGVILCKDAEEAENALRHIMLDRAFGDAGRQVVVERLLQGEEISCIALTDGEDIALLASSKDHKRAFDGDQGPNTGGMGAISPATLASDELEEMVLSRVLKPLMAGLSNEGIRYRGVLYAGLMITADGPYVLEFNVRFGDPETQPLMMRLKSDLVEAFMACIQGNLRSFDLEWDTRPSVCVVMASGGYPGSYTKGKPIRGLSEIDKMDDIKVFHAGTEMKDDRVVTSGGRVLGVTALGRDLSDAVNRAYQGVEKIEFSDSHFRRDIGKIALERR